MTTTTKNIQHQHRNRIPILTIHRLPLQKITYVLLLMPLAQHNPKQIEWAKNVPGKISLQSWKTKYALLNTLLYVVQESMASKSQWYRTRASIGLVSLRLNTCANPVSQQKHVPRQAERGLRFRQPNFLATYLLIDTMRREKWHHAEEVVIVGFLGPFLTLIPIKSTARRFLG